MLLFPFARLVEDEERLWTNENVNKIAVKHFPNINRQEALKRPILYSNWLSKDYVPVDQEELRDYVKARLKVSMSRPDSRSVCQGQIQGQYVKGGVKATMSILDSKSKS